MEPQNVLTDHHQVRRPDLSLDVRLPALPRVAGRREVVDESVDPDVDGVVGVVRDGDAPGQAGGGAGDGQVREVGGVGEVE